LVYIQSPTNQSAKNNYDQPIFGGDLYGKIEFDIVEPEVIEALNDGILKNTYNDDSFARKIVKSIVYENVSKFIIIIKEIYGQFWVRELEPWDSRKRTIYDYCHKIGMQWSLDNKNWYEFNIVYYFLSFVWNVCDSISIS
jgi:hypothetical protein